MIPFLTNDIHLSSLASRKIFWSVVGSVPFKTEQEQILEPQPSRPRADLLARTLPSDEEDAHLVFAGCAEELAREDVDDGGERETGLEEAVPEGRLLRDVARLFGRESESV